MNFQSNSIQWNINNQIHVTPFSNQRPQVINIEKQIRNFEVLEEITGQVSLSDNEQKQFLQLMDKYENIFSDKPGLIRNLECQIQIKPGEPIYQRPYPIPMSKTEKMDRDIKRMIDMQIIEKSTSPWSSPIIGTEKKMETSEYV